LTIRLNSRFKAVQLLTTVPDLYIGLTCMDWDNFTHCRRMKWSSKRTIPFNIWNNVLIVSTIGICPLRMAFRWRGRQGNPGDFRVSFGQFERTPGIYIIIARMKDSFWWILEDLNFSAFRDFWVNVRPFQEGEIAGCDKSIDNG
jgi:hypothetical protein